MKFDARIEELLSNGVASESGRSIGVCHMHSVKALTEASVFLSMNLYKFVRDDSVSCAALASDSEDEVYIAQAIQAAHVAINQARERVTKLYIAALKDAGRV